MLQCQIISGELGVALPVSKENYHLAILKTKQVVRTLRENHILEEVTDDILEELKNQLNPMYNQFCKKVYVPTKIMPDDFKTLMIKFLILRELGNPDIDLEYFEDKQELTDNLNIIGKICKNTDCTNKGIHRCSGCGWTKYCSRECQKDHWKEHKKKCFQNGKPENV